jgi:hypothetical protein
MSKRKISQDYHDLALARNFFWIERLPVSTLDKTEWKCQNGHIWQATYTGIRRGDNCPKCSAKIVSLKLTGRAGHKWHKKGIDDYLSLAKLRGLTWNDDPVLPKNTHTKTSWVCKSGHQWMTTYKLIHKGRGCPYCANLSKKEDSDYEILARQSGIQWLGPSCKYVREITNWRCTKNHEWSASYNCVQQDHGCPECLDFVNGCLASKPQRKIHSMVGGELNKKEGRYRIDVAIEKCGKRVAIEYDSFYWHKKDAKDKEDRRDAFLVERGWKVLHIRGGRSVPLFEDLNFEINDLMCSDQPVSYLIQPDWKT